MTETLDSAASRTRDLYLDLVKRCALGLVYEDDSLLSFPDADLARGRPAIMPGRFDRAQREAGLDIPSRAHSMIGVRRMDNLRFCVEQALDDNVAGDLIETGVYRGGASIFMRAILKAHGVSNRVVWVADSFQGPPEPDTAAHPEDGFFAELWSKWSRGEPRSAALARARARRAARGEVAGRATNPAAGTRPPTLDEVKRNFELYGLLDDQVRFLPGWFKDTLPTAPIAALAVLRLDGDFYASTLDALQSLYPKLSRGGYLIVDDFNLPPCAKAVLDYRQRHQIAEPLVKIDACGVFWRRT
jgi:hypothetical protein